MAGEAAGVKRFQAGGALREGSLYVPRAADRELGRALADGQLCYVFATTQTGKSSLKLRVAGELAKGGARTTLIDLGGVTGGPDTTEDQWYYGLAWAIASEAGLAADPDAVWNRTSPLTPVQRWSAFLREQLLPSVTGRLVVFLDEINVLLGVTFSADPFFASVREVYDARASDARFEAVTFCLLGIAFPEALMKDAARTPFRGARPITVADFTREEMDALLPGLAGAGGDPAAILDEVFAWTHGHPYMTQRVCAGIMSGVGVGVRDEDSISRLLLAPDAGGRNGDEKRERGGDKEMVRRAVARVFLDPGKDRDPNLRFAERYLARKGVPAAEVIFLYRRLLEGEAVVFDPNREVEQHVCLSGLAAARPGPDGKRRLQVRNRIFEQAFDLDWVREREAQETFGDRLREWLAAPTSHKDGYLLRGPDLEERLARAAKRGELSKAEEAFLRASQEEASREQVREAALEKQRREQAEERERITRRYVRWLAGLVIALVLALGGAAFEWMRARDAWHLAQQRAKDAQEARDRYDLQTRTEMGRRAVALADLPGSERAALVLGIQAMTWNGAAPATAPPAVVDGLVRGLTAARELDSMDDHAESVRAVAFSPDGTTVATAGEDTTMKLWTFSGDRSIATLRGHTNFVVAVAFSPDGKRLLTASADGTARLWDASTRAWVATLSGHADGVVAAVFSPDGARVATASLDKTARIWSAKDGTPLRTLAGHAGAVNAVAFSPDGASVVTGSEDKTARIWDASQGTFKVLQDAMEGVRVVAVSPDGKIVATGDRSVRLWSAEGGKLLRRLVGAADLHPSDVRALGFSPDGSRLVAASADISGIATVWSVNDGLPTTLAGHTAGLRAAAFSPDGKRVATAGDDSTARLWDAANGMPIAVLSGHFDAVLALAFSPDGSKLVTAGADKYAKLWDATDGKSLSATADVPTSNAGASPDGSRVVNSDKDGSVQLVDANGRLIKVLAEHVVGAITGTFSSDGALLVTYGANKAAHLWNARTGESLAPPLTGHEWIVRNAAFSADGKVLATASGDKSAQLWSVPSGKSLDRVLWHDAGVDAVTFSPDGRVVATASDDRTARLWDVATGEPLAVLWGHRGPVTYVAFSDDGRHLTTAGKDGTRTWPATAEGFLIQACAYLAPWPAFDDVRKVCAPWLGKAP